MKSIIFLLVVILFGVGLFAIPTIGNKATVPVVAQNSTIEQVQHNGVTGFLQGVQNDSFAITAEVCLSLPSNADWIPTFTFVTGENQQTADSWEIINWREPTTLEKNQRCYRVVSADLPADQAGPSQLVVEHLATSINELITEEDCAAAQEKLGGTNPEVKFECRPYRSTRTVEVTQKPDSLSIEEAYRLAYLAFVEVVEGPWKFPLPTSSN